MNTKTQSLNGSQEPTSHHQDRQTVFVESDLEREVSRILKINRSCIVRGNLDRHAEEYLQKLSGTDPVRFRRTILMVKGVLDALRTRSEFFGLDPKPFLYSALFAFASKSERDHYLDTHFFTRTILAVARGEPDRFHLPQVSTETIFLVERCAALLCETLFLNLIASAEAVSRILPRVLKVDFTSHREKQALVS